MGLSSFPLNNGATVPAIDFGTGTKWYKPGEGPVSHDLVQILKSAITHGFTHIDGAEAYGTEQEVGIAIKDSGIAREKLFVATKVLDSIADIPAALDASLKKLQLDYVDLYMIHSPNWTTDESKLQEACKSIEAVQRSGKAKSIGVSNYLRQHIEATLKVATIVRAVNQIEFHRYLQRANQYVHWLQSQGICVSGFKPPTPITVAAGGPLDAVVERIAKAHGVSVDSVLLQWQVQNKVIPITTTAKPSRLDKYWEATQFELSESEMDEITAVGLTHHFRNWGRNRFTPDDHT